MKNKIVLTICLVIGLSFLVATFSCQPMYQLGAMNRLIGKSFADQMIATNSYPTVILQKGSFVPDGEKKATELFQNMEQNNLVWQKYLGDTKMVAKQKILELEETNSIRGFMDQSGKEIFYNKDYAQRVKVKVSCMEGILEHCKISDYSDSTKHPEEIFPCMVTQRTMEACKLSIGGVIQVEPFINRKGESLALVITGVLEEKDQNDLFWYEIPESFNNQLWVSMEDMDQILEEYRISKLQYRQSCLLDYHGIHSGNVSGLQGTLQAICGYDASVSHTLNDFFQMYERERKNVGLTLLVLDIPLLGMALAFIYMVARQIVESERNEIAMLSGRGIKRCQIFFTYVVQSLIMAVIALGMGILLGCGFCYLAAATTDFFRFDFAYLGYYRPVPSMLFYGGAAVLVGMLFIWIPVVRASRISITTRKAEVIQDKKPIWEKCYLDLILLGSTLYLWYNFIQNIENLRKTALTGSGVDPIVFLDTVLFMIATGLVCFRLTHYLIRFCYRILKKRLSCVQYVSFLQIMRTKAKQGFISTFLIVTIALGLFYANTARTINENENARVGYEQGADVRIGENWKIFICKKQPDNTLDYKFYEPSYGRYQGLVTDGLCTKITRVIESQTTTITAGNKTLDHCMFQGIHTKEFGEIAILQEGLNQGKHWYHALNALSQSPTGVIISENAARELSVEVGDHVTLERFGEVENFEKLSKGVVGLSVVAIVSDWPGYERYQYDEDGNQKEQYLMVTNYATSVSAFQKSPYRVWCKLAPGVTDDAVEKYLREKHIQVSSYLSMQRRLEDIKSEPNIQITNGMFTMGFLFTIILCGVGFLIYWITSIKQRDLLFGVYRAMGMSAGEVGRILLYEHLFSTVLSILIGIGTGVLTTRLFEQIFGIVYLPKKHNITLETVIRVDDIGKLFAIIFVMVVVCLVIIIRYMRVQKITDALKLGED